jgi:hypothetical protein
MQALFTEGDMVDVRPEERTGRRKSVGGRSWVKKVAPGTPTTAPSYSVEYIVDGLWNAKFRVPTRPWRKSY